MIGWDKLTAYLVLDAFCHNDPNDPIRQMMEEKHGAILKMFHVVDGSTIIICEKKE